MNIILIGLPASGKTTIGQILAARLERDFIDTDRLIENNYAMHLNKSASCREIYRCEGEKRFRELEKIQIESLRSTRNAIISIGGGALCDPDNLSSLTSIGIMIYLKASLPVLWERIQETGRPAYLCAAEPEKAFLALAAKRIPIFEKAARIIIETDQQNPQDAAVDILNMIRNEHGK